MDYVGIIDKLNFSNIIWQVMTPLIFSFVDIVTGYIQAWINKNIDSQKMRVGLLHKVLIILVIVLSFVIQFAFNIKYISGFVCIYVVLMEIVSIFENLKKAGIDLGKLGELLKDKTTEDTTESVNKLVNTIDEVIKKEG